MNICIYGGFFNDNCLGYEMEFCVNKKVNLLNKSKYTQINVLGYDGVISKENASYMFFSKNEKEMFDLLKNNTIIDSLKLFYKMNNGDKTEPECIIIMKNLLKKIDDAKFYNDYNALDQENDIDFNRIIQINLTNNCNMRCLHCFLSAGYVPIKELDIEKILKIAREIKDKGLASEIVISGGEALMYKQLVMVLKELQGCNVTLFTNGSLINEKNCDVILPLVNEIQISFEGITKNFYELIRGNGNYGKVLNAIKLIKKYNKKLSLAITVLPDTISDVEKNIVSFIKSLDYSNIEIRLNDELEIKGNAVNLKNKNIDKLDSARRIGHIMNTLYENKLATPTPSRQGIKFLNCGVGASILINFDGKIYPCYQLEKMYHSIDEDITNVLNDFSELNKESSVNNIEMCKNCELKYICCGGCKVKNHSTNGDTNIPICDKSQKYKNILLQYIKDYGMD